MARTLCKGAEAACPTTTGAATSFSEATVVRLVNTHNGNHLVTVVETQSGTVVGSFTMPTGAVEYLEKNQEPLLKGINKLCLIFFLNITNYFLKK